MDTSDVKRVFACQLFGDVSLSGLYCDPAHHVAVAANLRDLHQWLGATDLRILNLESPVWGDGQVNKQKSPRLSTTTEAAEILLELEPDLVLLANNHIADCLSGGLSNTLALLQDRNIRAIGAASTPEGAREPAVFERQGFRIGVLNYVGAETHPNVPPAAGVYINELEPDRAQSEVRSLSAVCDFVLVFPHWGIQERAQIPTPAQRRLGRQLVEAGADVVAGAHVHTLQGWEQWCDGAILYGLGNFLFSPHITTPGAVLATWTEDSRRGAVAEVLLSPAAVPAVKWHFTRQPAGSLLVEPDTRPERTRDMKRRSVVLRSPEGAFARRSRLERIWSQLRYQRDRHGLAGLLGMLGRPAKLGRLARVLRARQ